MIRSKVFSLVSFQWQVCTCFGAFRKRGKISVRTNFTKFLDPTMGGDYGRDWGGTSPNDCQGGLNKFHHPPCLVEWVWSFAVKFCSMESTEEWNSYVTKNHTKLLPTHVAQECNFRFTFYRELGYTKYLWPNVFFQGNRSKTVILMKLIIMRIIKWLILCVSKNVHTFDLV